MNGVPSRVAVQVGSATVRIAGAAAEGEPWLVAELPDPADQLDRLLVELVGTALDELVVVHPPSWPEPRVAVLARGLIGLARQLRTVPVPLAAAGGGPRVVLDVGHTGAEVTRLAEDGTVQLCRSSPVGGALLDEVLVSRLEPAPPAEARRMRERLSLLPSVEARLAGGERTLRIREAEVHGGLAAALRGPVELLREVLVDGDPAPVLLIGGVARAPLLAELVDELVAELTRPVHGREGVSPTGQGDGFACGGARRPGHEIGCPRVVVAPTPEAAAVLGALRWAGRPLVGGAESAAGVLADGPESRCPASRFEPSPASPFEPSPASRFEPTPATGCGRDPPVALRSSGDPPAGHTAGDPAGHVRARFPLPPRRRPVRTALLASTAVLMVAVLLALGAVLAPPTGAVSVPAGVLVQYGYRLELPAGWEHSGGLPQRRRVLLTPVTAPEGSDVIAVERTPLGYDGDAERQRALAELRAVFDTAVSGGSALSDFRIGQLAGRQVVSYRQRDAGRASEVDWYVILDGDAQLSVGCRHTPPATDVVRAACAVVVGSARRG